MSHVSRYGTRSLLIVVAIISLVALSTVAVSAECAVQGSQTKTTMEKTPATSSAMGSSMNPSMGSLTGSSTGSSTDLSWIESSSAIPTTLNASVGVASNIGQDALLVKCDAADGAFETVHGVIGLSVRKSLDVATANSLDYAVARVHIPSDNSVYTVKFTSIDSAGPFGGIGLSETMFGNTGIGDSKMPRTVVYITLSGKADILKDDKLIISDTPAHICVTPGIWDSAKNSFASTDSVDFTTRNIVLGVPGPVEGLPDGNLMVAWPQASLNLWNVGGRVMPSQEVMMAKLIGEPALVAVAGVAAELQRVRISLTPMGFSTTGIDGIMPGLVTFTVVNDSLRNRGLIVRGVDVAGRPLHRYTSSLRPGEAASFQMYIAPGRWDIAEYYHKTPAMMYGYKSAYQKSFDVGPL